MCEYFLVYSDFWLNILWEEWTFRWMHVHFLKLYMNSSCFSCECMLFLIVLHVFLFDFSEKCRFFLLNFVKIILFFDILCKFVFVFMCIYVIIILFIYLFNVILWFINKYMYHGYMHCTKYMYSQNYYNLATSPRLILRILHSFSPLTQNAFYRYFVSNCELTFIYVFVYRGENAASNAFILQYKYISWYFVFNLLLYN